MGTIVDNFKFGAKSICAAEADIHGSITIGAGTVLHPRCTIMAISGPIIIGENCIVEENVILLNRSNQPMIIGPSNLFEVGCRVEALSIGANNVFEPKCRVPKTISISDWTCIGAGCTVLPVATFSDETEEQNELQQDEPIEILPSRTMVYGADCERRIWSGEARLQAQGLHVKQLDALHELLPRFLKMRTLPSE